MRIRSLGKGDEEKLEQYLKQHAEYCMFLRSNLKHSGLIYHDSPFHGEYFASFDNLNNINGVIAHFWNGNIMMQSENIQILDSLLQLFQKTISRPIMGILGPSEQAKSVIDFLNIQPDKFAINRAETLYSIQISNLKSYSPKNQKFDIVDANKVDSITLFEWLKDYRIEALGAADTNELDKHVNDELSRMVDGMDRWVLVVNSEPCCLVGFNARLPDIVQLGPVWTPVKFRNKGYAKMLVSFCLEQAQNAEVKTAILFTDNPAAIRAYESLGFVKCGSFRLAIIK